MKKLLQILMILLCSTSALVMAQAADKSDYVSKVVESIISEERNIIKEYIQLTEAEAKDFWPIYDDYQSTMRDFLPKIVVLINKFVSEYETLSDKQADVIIEEIMDTQKESIEIKKSYVKKFRRVLPPKKLLELIHAESSIEIGFTLKFMSEISYK